jgi:hypothetical protein
MLFPGEGLNAPVIVGRIDEIYLGADGAFTTIQLDLMKSAPPSSRIFAACTARCANIWRSTTSGAARLFRAAPVRRHTLCRAVFFDARYTSREKLAANN